jgi:hypothetical protein
MRKVYKFDLSESYLIIAKVRRMIDETHKRVTESHESQLGTTQQIEKTSELIHLLQSETWRWFTPQIR